MAKKSTKTSVKKQPIHHGKVFIAKELFLGVLAVFSIGIVMYDTFGKLTDAQRATVDRIDFCIAILFLVDWILSYYFSRNRPRFFRRNWYLLLAAIPFTDTLTQALRGLRVLRLLRILRAGEHLNYGLTSTKNSK